MSQPGQKAEQVKRTLTQKRQEKASARTAALKEVRKEKRRNQDNISSRRKRKEGMLVQKTREEL